MPGAIDDAESFLKRDDKTRIHLDRVAALVEGFETPFGMELLSSVHWVVAKEGARTLDEALAHTYAWNERKKHFSRHHVAVALDVLRTKGWVAAA